MTLRISFIAQNNFSDKKKKKICVSSKIDLLSFRRYNKKRINYKDYKD